MKFEIQGGKRLSGTVEVSGNKNAALPMIAASLLSAEETVLENVPDIADVSAMLDAARRFGATVRRDAASGTVAISTPRLKSASIPPELAAKIRTSVLFAGPLLARSGRAILPPPGGDAIGHRRLDTHFAGFRALGARASAGRKTLRFSGALRGAKMLLDEASVTATENILMASVLARGRTEIYNAACEPHVCDLAAMLNSMGAKIEGAGTNLVRVEGVDSLHGCRARVGSDYIEACSYMAAAAATGGELTLHNVDPAPLAAIEPAFRRFGVSWTADAKERTVRMPPRRRARMRYDLGDAIPSLADGPWPAFPSDLMSVLIVLATQTRGTCLFFEKMFESRLYFVDGLRQMGAKIVQCDPHRVVVTGSTTLHGGTFASPDIRAGIALVIAALAAKGRSTILEAGVVDRGYASLETKLRALGATIERSGE